MNTGPYGNLTVVITGASSAFGSGTARRLAAGGAALVLGSSPDQVLDEMARELESSGGRAVAVPTDVTRPEDVKQIAAAAVRQYGRIDVWVNNAGSGAIGLFADVPPEAHARVIETDLLGTIYGSYFAMNQFCRQGAGILINVASVVGKVPSPYLASYVAAKHGVVGLSAALRQELQETKVTSIHVCTVLPATFDTPFFEYSQEAERPVTTTSDSNEVVNAIVGLITEPKDEISVGSATKVSIIAHQLFPGIVESYMARETHKAERDAAASERELF